MRRTFARVLVACLLLSLRPSALGQVPLPEEAVEAAYLHKFPGFMEWPADALGGPDAPIVIGIIDAPEVLEHLIKLAQGRLVLNRRVEARAVNFKASLPRMHLIFVGRDASVDMKKLVADARLEHAVVITDVGRGQDAEAVLAFVRVDGRLRFDASLPAAKLTGVKLSSKLLSVANKVIEASH